MFTFLLVVADLGPIDIVGIDAAGAQTWDMLGTEVGPFDDRRPRILFTTTATVRNRALSGT